MDPTKLEFSIVSAATISEILTEDRSLMVKLVSDAYNCFADNQAINPHSSFLSFSELQCDSPNRIIALPAFLGGTTQLAGVKWVASFPDNRHVGLPRASAILVLNDAKTGYPVACLEGSLISAARTAASAVLGAGVLCGPARNRLRIGFVGAGVIAWSIFQSFLSQNWSFSSIILFDLLKERSDHFRQRAATLVDTPIFVAAQLRELLIDVDLLILASTATCPYIELPDIHKGMRILNVSLRDLSPDVILASDNVVDDIDHCLRHNTSPHLAEKQLGSRAFSIANIYDCFGRNGYPAWTSNPDRPAIFSPFGMGILDIALGGYVYERAKQKNQVSNISQFFSDIR